MGSTRDVGGEGRDESWGKDLEKGKERRSTVSTLWQEWPVP